MLKNPHLILFLSTKVRYLLLIITPRATKLNVFLRVHLVKKSSTQYVSRPVFRYWGDSDGGICNPSPPTHCRNKQSIPQNIELISIERCILGSARSSPSQFNLCFLFFCFFRKKRNRAGRGFPFLCFCLSSVHYTVAGTSNKPELRVNPDEHIFLRTWPSFRETLRSRFHKNDRPFHCLSCPLGATFSLVLAQTILSTSIKHQNDPLSTLSMSK